MHVMLEVILAPGAQVGELLTQETIEDTKARVMTQAEVEKLGFQSLADGPEGCERRFIVVGRSDQRRIQNHLETLPRVTGFRVHDFDL
ncbi:hypothetical protein ENSA5_53790 [Enhygromyxa salina]|uniref:Uncharacterized protein n=1 Tax=Enhygromyxa salina TaxID=215803 RepID=A0A2S9XFI1_9BACT|nr:hypothetical protein [Enhygromyxa salina]PRP91619.1 hypothetical protein ENSA5_53790 [Enhygromyxa salina]